MLFVLGEGLSARAGGGTRPARKRLPCLGRWTRHSVGDPQVRLEAAALVEPMNAGIRPPALQHDVMAVLPPGFLQRGGYDGASVPSPFILGMRCNVLDNAVLAPASQKIGGREQHACCNQAPIGLGYENAQAIARESTFPDRLGLFLRLSVTTDLRGREEIAKQLEQGHEVG